MKRSKIKVRHRKLGKHQAIGLCWFEDKNDGKGWLPTGEIEIDERLKGKEHLQVTIHECLHLINKTLSEKIDTDATKICEVLWKLNYRRVDT